MTKIIEVYRQLTAEHVKWLANVLSTVEQRYENGDNTTSNVANYQKHPIEDKYWFYYNEVLSNMGETGQQIVGFLLSDYEPTGDPVINTDVINVKEVNLLTEGYIILESE
jgi:hypothetical protein